MDPTVIRDCVRHLYQMRDEKEYSIQELRSAREQLYEDVLVAIAAGGSRELALEALEAVSLCRRYIASGPRR